MIQAHWDNTKNLLCHVWGLPDTQPWHRPPSHYKVSGQTARQCFGVYTKEWLQNNWLTFLVVILHWLIFFIKSEGALGNYYYHEQVQCTQGNMIYWLVKHQWPNLGFLGIILLLMVGCIYLLNRRFVTAVLPQVMPQEKMWTVYSAWSSPGGITAKPLISRR